MYNFPEEENKILEFWKEKKIFEKLRKKNQRKKKWSFLDGPITANNPMGVHHAWGRSYKDLFQRYFAMKGCDERYQNGFDCQGLWVEVGVEKDLGFNNKKDIEKYGIEKFVNKCKERVLKYSKIQTEQSIRLGQWMDWDNSYYTMSDENNYSIWAFLKKCNEKGYLYKGRDSVPWCPRCGTAISQHEILTEEYKLITHKAIYFKLPIIKSHSAEASRDKQEKISFLVWTTTPWTIPANSGLIVNPDFVYGQYEYEGEKLILLKSLAEKILGKVKLEKEFKGKELEGMKYEGPFDDLERVKQARNDKFHTVVLDKDLVTEVEGTGIVHCAPGAGEEDFKIGKKEGLPVIDVIDESATYLEGMGEFSKKNAKDNPEIILDYLKEKKEFFFKVEDYTHRYPTCWRCKTELVWRVVDEWYISMDKLRKPLEKIVKKINWIPSFGLERELDWLKNMHDWLISKKRYWGLALPIYECECGNFEVIGSKEELKERAVEGWEKFDGNSPHRPWVDEVKIKCPKCGKIVSRIKDVGNPWLDAGIVPFSTMGYFSDNKYWKEWFPPELVCESFPGQFKNWFYSILVMSAVLEDSLPSKTIFGFASVKDDKGEEMHKSKGNAIWFDEAVEKAGADPMRWMYARQNPAENLRFGYDSLGEVKRRLLTLYNVYAFFNTYVDKNEIPKKSDAFKNILDKWIVSRFNSLLLKAESSLDKYDPMSAVIAIDDFYVNDLSLWYVRRSRDRFHNNEKQEASACLYYILINLAKIISPIIPFFAEVMYQSLKTDNLEESVHLCDWPKADEKLIDKDLESNMAKAREIAAMALAERAEKGIKVRQPLAKLKFRISNFEFKNKEILELIKDEVNVKEIIFVGEKPAFAEATAGKEVELDTEITEELKQEGNYREIVRTIKALRKELGLTTSDKINIYLNFEIKDLESLKKDAGAESVEMVSNPDGDAKKEINLDENKCIIAIKKA